MRKSLIVGNWKMYKMLREASQLVLDLKPLVVNARHCEIAVAPPFTALKTVGDRLEGSNIRLAAQDIGEHIGQGAFTGEVSGEMLQDLGCSYVIIGHSERRQYYKETDEVTNRKVKAALGANLRPILCIGETLVEREDDHTEMVLSRQLHAGLAGLTTLELSNIIIAYEPIWAIGTGCTATPEMAGATHHFIRSTVANLAGAEISQSLIILYGGSVKPDNITALMQEQDIDGALVGGASLEANSFARIVNYLQ
jgi:triosephosphate isomerase (TIM)